MSTADQTLLEVVRGQHDTEVKPIGEVLAQFPAGTPAGDVALISIPNTSYPPVPRVPNVIKFKKVRRDCPYNTQIETRGQKKGIIYDYQIFIDGEFRGTWMKRGASQRAYMLVDSIGERVNSAPSSSRIQCDVVARDQGRFEYLVNRHVNQLPPPATDAERKARKELQEIEEAAETERKSRLRRINALSPLMYDLLQSIYSKGNAHPEDFQKMFKIRCQVEDGEEILTDV